MTPSTATAVLTWTVSYRWLPLIRFRILRVVWLQEDHPGRRRKPRIDGSVGDLEGADLTAAVAGVHAAVGDRDTGPVQVVQMPEQVLLILLDDHHVVREEGPRR